MADPVCVNELPTKRELELFNMRIETAPNNITTVQPLQEFEAPVENFLPPSGPYLDEFILENKFGKEMFNVYINRQLSKSVPCMRYQRPPRQGLYTHTVIGMVWSGLV
ncbi:hypothetical protein PtrM4_145940 [Pyrenophora tritici-repentis]|uniref:Uncharacterized protein n=1 Tax=Pyrenophora tritici-repentis TaxID=45151 RepID=A0A316ZZ57_9PLEO|nr:hypothetical protein PtrM4_145940 [Pyrenophora tritici-repentis]